MKIALIVALQTEFDLVKNIFSTVREFVEHNITYMVGKINNNEVALMKCGIGKVNSAVKLWELTNVFRPDLVINAGVAGSVSSDVGVMDFVVATSCCYHDVWCGDGSWGQVQGLPLFFETNTKIVNIAKKLASDNTHFGVICTGDQFITNADELSKIKENFPMALAVDMESASMAQVCYLKQIPFSSIRIISDTPGESEDNSQQYFDFWEIAPKRSFELLQKILEQI